MNGYQVRVSARKLLSEFGITSFPVDIFKVAEMISARVMLTKELPQKISGYLLPISNGRSNFLIGVNWNKSFEHIRFTIAHEIGHIVNGDYQYKAILLDSLELDTPETERYPFIHERFANIFAAELLMPSYMVKRYAEKEKNINMLCARFGVSHSAMMIRLFDELGYNKEEFLYSTPRNRSL